jgi:hypothetical protein
MIEGRRAYHLLADKLGDIELESTMAYAIA